MLIDTHCHINIMLRGYKVKPNFQVLSYEEIQQAQEIIQQASVNDVTSIINVGTDLVESLTCIELAKLFPHNFAIIGIHPNDSKNWQKQLQQLHPYLKNSIEHKIVGIGECGIDKHYPDYNLKEQEDAFKAQIELALTYNLGLSIHSRDAAEETFKILDYYRNESNFRGVMHCFSYTPDYAQEAINMNFVLGIGGTVTYPKNKDLRQAVIASKLTDIILETDAPFLPPQHIRGKKNSPDQIKTIAQFIAHLKNSSLQEVAKTTSKNAKRIFGIEQ